MRFLSISSLAGVMVILLLIVGNIGFGPNAVTTLLDAKNERVGEGRFKQNREGVIVSIKVDSLRPGKHGVVIISKGDCQQPDLITWDAIFNPWGKRDGAKGLHEQNPGVLGNLEVKSDRTGILHTFIPKVTLSGGEASLFQQEGTSLVICDKPDIKQTTQDKPAIEKIACGVISKPSALDFDALLSHSILLFNVEIPTIIFSLTMIFIFFPFLYYSLNFTLREVPLALSRFNELGRVFEELRLKEPEGHLTGAGLDELRHRTKMDQKFADAWKSFDRTLIHEGSEKVHIWASQPLSEAFNLRSLAYQINLDLYRVLPGILTGLGLLLTFLAILIALSGVKVLQDQSVSGIDLLVSGLSGKFFSSVVALLLATAFLMEERRQERRLNLGLTGMLQKLDNLLPRKTPEMLLFDIRKENIEQSRAIRTLVTDMADKLPASFQESLSPIMLAMSDAIERLKNEQLAALNNLEQVIPPKIKEVLSDLFSARLDTMTSALERFQQQTIQGTQDTFSELVASFKQTLTGTTDTQFSRLAEVLSTTSEVLHDLVDKFQQTQQVLDEQIGRVLQAVQSQTMTLTQGVVDKFMETVEHLKSLTQASSQTLAATADQAVAHVAEQGQQYLVNLEKVGKSLEDQVTRMMDVMHRQTGMVTDETSKALQEAVTQIRAISEASVQHVSQASESALDQLTQRGGEYFDQARGTLEHLVRRAAELAEALNRTSENILIGAEGVGTTIKQYETAIQSGTNLVQALQGISASMIAVSRDSRMVTENWTSVVAAQQEVTGRLNRVMEEMGKISRDSHGLMESAPKVFSGIHQEYRQIVEVVNNNIRDYTDTVKHGLENYLQQANTYFNDTVHQLGSAVMELSETLPELTEELQKALVILKKERRL